VDTTCSAHRHADVNGRQAGRAVLLFGRRFCHPTLIRLIFRLDTVEGIHEETSRQLATGYGVFTPLFGRSNDSKLTGMCPAGQQHVRERLSRTGPPPERVLNWVRAGHILKRRK